MNDSIKVYSSISCPKCRMLKMTLQQKGIEYEEITDVNVMASLNIKNLPMLGVNDTLLNLPQAMKWIQER